MFDAAAVRREFPILDQQVHGHPLVYLDNANTTQKPLSVIEALDHYYRADNANIHRATHLLSERATKAYEGARERIARFFNAKETAEIVFTRGCTEAINLVAYSFAPPAPEAGRRDSRHAHGAPLQHRAVAARGPADRAPCSAWCRWTSAACSTWRRTSACSGRARRWCR